MCGWGRSYHLSQYSSKVTRRPSAGARCSMRPCSKGGAGRHCSMRPRSKGAQATCRTTGRRSIGAACARSCGYVMPPSLWGPCSLLGASAGLRAERLSAEESTTFRRAAATAPPAFCYAIRSFRAYFLPLSSLVTGKKSARNHQAAAAKSFSCVFSSLSASCSAVSAASSCGARLMGSPARSRIVLSICAAMSAFSLRNALAFSRP